TGSLICLVQLLRPLPSSPLGLEAGQHPGNFAAVDSITALIWTAAVGILDRASGDRLSNDSGQLGNPVVLVGLTHIERLVVNQLAGSVKDAYHRGDDVANVYDRAPWSTVTFDDDLSGGEGGGDKVVQDDVQTQPGRGAVSGGISHEGRSELVARQLGHVTFY